MSNLKFILITTYFWYNLLLNGPTDKFRCALTAEIKYQRNLSYQRNEEAQGWAFRSAVLA